MALVDTAMTREVLREIGKHPLDISELQVHVTHGVLYVSGRVGKVRGYHIDYDLRDELCMVLRVLRNKPGLRDIVCEVELAGLSLEERSSQSVRFSHRDF